VNVPLDIIRCLLHLIHSHRPTQRNSTAVLSRRRVNRTLAIMPACPEEPSAIGRRYTADFGRRRPFGAIPGLFGSSNLTWACYASIDHRPLPVSGLSVVLGGRGVHVYTCKRVSHDNIMHDTDKGEC